MNIKYFALDLLISFYANSLNHSNQTPDQIVGKWMSVEGNITVQVLKEGNRFKATVLWFDDSDDKAKPMNTRTDEHNPDRTLRNQKIIGLQVLRNLKYNPKTSQWEDGIIYDSRTGKEWNSSVCLTNEGLLKVKGFWHFELISRTASFKKVG